MKKPLDVLHIEDNDNDVILILHELNKYWTNINHCRVEKLSDLEEALKKKWDVIISDFTLPEFDGLTALRLVRDNKIDTPFIVVSGRVDEDIAASMMRLGANDYVMKDNLKRLAPAILRELDIAEERAQIRSKLSGPIKEDSKSTLPHPKQTNTQASPGHDSIKERHKAVMNILYAANLVRKHQAKILEKHDLNEPIYNVLRILRNQSPKEVTIGTVRDEIDNKTSDVSRIIERMVKVGLVYYSINTKDKRIRNISLTQKGVDALTEMDKCADEMFLSDAFLPEESAKQVNGGLQKMLAMMRAN